MPTENKSAPKLTIEEQYKKDREYFGLGGSEVPAVEIYDSDEMLRQALVKPDHIKPFSSETGERLNEIRDRIKGAGGSPVTRALESEPNIPPKPEIDELGTSTTRESIPAMHAELAQILDSINFSGENVDLEDLKSKLESAHSLLENQIGVLSRDKASVGDTKYLDFLERMNNEVKIARERIEKLDKKMFGREIREEIVFAEFKIRAELQMMFPEEDPYELLENSKKLEQLIKEKFKINDAPDLKLGAVSHLKSITKGLRNSIMVGIGGTGMYLSGYLMHSVYVLNSSPSLYAYFGGIGVVGGLSVFNAVLHWNWDRQKSLAEDMVKHVEAIKEKVKGKYFPSPNPKPQFSKPPGE